MIDTVATLWIGPKLSFLERLSLKSFYDLGQTPVLYLYEEIEDPPEYVEIRDAREIMDEAFVRRHWNKDRLADPRIQADIFRVLLMRKTDHIWIDSDVYALRQHICTDGYLFSIRKKGFIPNSVMRVPRESAAIKEMEKFVSANGGIPPWWSSKQVDLQKEENSDFSFENLPVGVTGPEAFGHFIFATGEDKYAQPFHYLNPVFARHSTTLLQSPSPHDANEMRQNSMSLHLYATAIRRRLFKKQNGMPPVGSMLHDLCLAHDIDINAHPIEHRDSVQSARHRRRLYHANEGGCDTDA